MNILGSAIRPACLTVAVLLLSACQATAPLASGPDKHVQATPVVQEGRLDIEMPYAWGGNVRCARATGCRLVAVEHEDSTVVLHQIEGRKARLLDRQSVAYHPDSATWLSDDLVVAAVETSSSLDVFRVSEQGKLVLVHQISVDMAPRDVLLVQEQAGRALLLVTPYAGKEVVWVELDPAAPQGARVTRSPWCEAPWHPVALARAPGAPQGGVAAACLDDKRVVLAPQQNLMGPARTLVEIPAEGYIVPRHARPSPSGRWLYIALETGGRNLRFNLDSGELQWVASPLTGAVSVLPLADDLVIWGEDQQLYLQRLDAEGKVLETRWLAVDGLPTGLQLLDVDGDGQDDLVVHNSSTLPGKKGVNILFGPLWERAQPR